MTLPKNKRPTKDLIRKQMKTGVVNFTFKKKDGELREMNGTLQTRKMERQFIKEENPNPPGSDQNLMVCYDIDKKAWRSFKIDTIEEYKGVVAL